MRGCLGGVLRGVLIVSASGLVAGCSGNCLDRYPEIKNRAGLKMQGNFVARDVANDPWTDDVSSWPGEPARMVMGDGTLTLIVRVGADEYRLVYAMSKQQTRVLEID